VKAAGRCQIELARLAADLDQNGGEGRGARRLLRDPQGVHRFRRFGEEQAGRGQAETLDEAGRVGTAGLAQHFGRGDPEDRGRRIRREQRQRQRETGGGCHVTHRGGMDLGQARAGDSAARRPVEGLDAEGQAVVNGDTRPAQQHRAVVSLGFPWRLEPLGKAAFDPGDFPAQGNNGSPRHGSVCHGSLNRYLFLLCSYRFQSAAGESSRPIKEFIPFSGETADDRRMSRNGGAAPRKGFYPPGKTPISPAEGQQMARIDNSRAWRDLYSPSLEELEMLALDAYAHLPEEFRRLTGEIIIQLAEFPTDEIMDDLSLETPFDLLGLFEGRGIAERWNPATGDGPNRVTLYRRAILDYWAENQETLGDIVTHVLIHEIGHHFGLSDEDMERIEAGAP